jgi:molecular chaperone GrpE
MTTPDAPQAETAAPDLAALQQTIEQLTKERNEAKEQALRALADYRNLRKRVEQESQGIRAYALEQAVSAFLPAMDNLELAIASADQASSVKAVVDGIRLIQKQFEAALQQIGVTPIEAVGKPFDPSMHEAVAVAVSAEHPPDIVLEELRRGYVLNGRVIRASRVRVTKAPFDEGANE